MSVLGRLGEALAGRRVTPPMPLPIAIKASPPWFLTTCDEDDDYDDEPNQRDDSSSWSVFISYTNAKGEESERRLTCHKIDGFGSAETVFGFCHESRKAKAFRIDRIGSLVCCSTGEVFDPARRFAQLRETGAMNACDKALDDLGRLLVFLARCDGEFHPLEAEALGDCLGRYGLRFGCSDAMVQKAMKEVVRLAPDDADVIRVLKHFRKRSDGQKLAKFVLDCSANIVEADGALVREELAWAHELSSALKDLADGRPLRRIGGGDDWL